MSLLTKNGEMENSLQFVKKGWMQYNSPEVIFLQLSFQVYKELRSVGLYDVILGTTNVRSDWLIQNYVIKGKQTQILTC